MRIFWLPILAAAPLALAGCTGAAGPPGTSGEIGPAGETGSSGGDCAVADNGDGTFTMTCPASDPVTFGTNEVPAAYTNANLLRGGRLYDAFWEVKNIGATEPTSDHPLYPTFGTQTAGTTWRCKECHGWDYIGKDGRYRSGSHYTGIKGLYPAKKSVFSAFLTISQDHGYLGVGLNDADVWDLVKFYKEGMLDIDTVLNDVGDFQGSATRGADLYDNGISGYDANGTASVAPCANCHGADGTNTNPGAGAGHIEFPGLVSNDNPPEFLHKVRFGTPGTMMTGSVSVHASLQDAVDMGAYSQTLSPLDWTTTDVARGGQLYDKFWNVSGVTATEPTTTNPMYPALAGQALSTTWRCKECHGWDYIGKNGRYSSGSHYTGIAGLWPSVLTKWQAFEVIRDGHGYGAAGLSDSDVWDLVAFYKAGMEDLGFILNPDGNFSGVAASGQGLYDTTLGCAGCHNANGLNQTPPGGSLNGHLEVPGFLANENPPEFIHKARFGAPGTTMIKSYDTATTFKQIGDLGAYIQGLPCAPGPLFWDPVAGACQ